jgi:peptide deformylase
MARLSILEFPDPRLRTRAQPVEQVDAGLRTLIDDMFETMYAAPGIGLAATQVNVHKRLLVIDVSESRDEPLALINPEILSRAGLEETEEGCLSVPGIYDKVTRADHIRVRALDRDGRQIEFDAEGLLAV